MIVRAKDLTGLRFGTLTVLHRAATLRPGKARWQCRCDCGGEITVFAFNLTSGAQHRCSACASKAQAKTLTKHGACASRLYKTWNDMLQRCDNPNLSNYRNYGGKGVKVCDAWRDFEGFQAWALLAGYADDLTIDRIDSDGDYEPDNCRWLSRSENARRGSLSRWHKQESAHA